MKRALAWLLCGATYLACGIGAVGLVALLGYVLEWSSLYNWLGSDAPMASNTAIGFAATGCALFMLVQAIKIHTDGLNEEDEIAADAANYGIFFTKFNPADIIAVLAIVGSFVAICLGHAQAVLGVLVAVTGYYFGRLDRPKNGKHDGGENK